MPTKRTSRTAYVVCLKNEGYPASLELRKLYRSVADASASKRGMIRVIDESGEDYLYPAEWFAPVNLEPAIRRAVTAAE